MLGSEGRERARGRRCRKGLGTSEVRRSGECERYEESEGRHGYRYRRRKRRARWQGEREKEQIVHCRSVVLRSSQDRADKDRQDTTIQIFTGEQVPRSQCTLG